jgi:hypothetical protein
LLQSHRYEPAAITDLLREAQSEAGLANLAGERVTPRESGWAERHRALDAAEQVQRLDAMLVGFHLNVQHQVARRIARRWGKGIKIGLAKVPGPSAGAPDLWNARLKETGCADRLPELCSASRSHRVTIMYSPAGSGLPVFSFRIGELIRDHIDGNKIPPELKDLRQWVGWLRRRHEKGKLAKLPFNEETGKPASVTDPATWSSFDEALAARQRYDGIGFALSDSGERGEQRRPGALPPHPNCRTRREEDLRLEHRRALFGQRDELEPLWLKRRQGADPVTIPPPNSVGGLDWDEPGRGA